MASLRIGRHEDDGHGGQIQSRVAAQIVFGALYAQSWDMSRTGPWVPMSDPGSRC